MTDHRPLLKILGPHGVPTLAAARLQGWALILSAYRYNLQYTPGLDNVDPCETLPVTAAEVVRETQRDPVLRRVYQYTRCGWRHTSDIVLEPSQRRSCELSIENGCILWANRVIIPSKLRSTVLEELHEGHLGVSRMKALARSFIWWPNLDKELEDTAKRCELCQRQQAKPAKTNTAHPWINPEKAWERVHADFAEYAGKQYLLLVDAYSKWPEVHMNLGTLQPPQTVEVQLSRTAVSSRY